jgi:hypothetical protein
MIRQGFIGTMVQKCMVHKFKVWLRMIHTIKLTPFTNKNPKNYLQLYNITSTISSVNYLFKTSSLEEQSHQEIWDQVCQWLDTGPPGTTVFCTNEIEPTWHNK